MIQRKSLMMTLNLNFKRQVLTLLLSGFFYTLNAQDFGFLGNMEIKASILQTSLNGFYKFIVDKRNDTFNCSEYFVRVNITAIDDSTNYIEMSLYNFKLASQEQNPNNFYGYLTRNNIYFVFSNENKLVAKVSKISNPKLFGKSAKLNRNTPKQSYDPYRWELVVCNNQILQKSPPETIDKYVTQ